MQGLKPVSTGYAEAAEGLEIHYEIYGEGEPIVMLAGGLMPISTMAQITGLCPGHARSSPSTSKAMAVRACAIRR